MSPSRNVKVNAEVPLENRRGARTYYWRGIVALVAAVRAARPDHRALSGI